MDARKKSLGQIFDPSIRLIVPLFQRPYVWEQGDSWGPLWESITTLADRRLVGGNTPRPYFLGALVLEQLATRTGSIEARQVIDGQQRLTTIQIALAAARDVCNATGAANFAKAFRKLTDNDKGPISDEQDDVFKVWPTNVDRDSFRSVMKAGSRQEVCKCFGADPNAKQVGPHKLIAGAFLYFYDEISKWLGPPADGKFAERLGVLWQTIKDDMEVVVIDLDKNDDAQVIFETLNARGTPLLPADLVKNYLFQSAEARKENIMQLYEAHWKPFDKGDGIWRQKVGQGRLKRPRIDQFLQHYLVLMTGEEIPATHLFAEFRIYAQKTDVPAADHLRSLHAYGAVFERFHTGYDFASREGQFFYRQRVLETTTFFPVLLEVFKTADAQAPQEIATVLTDIESFLVRRMVCGLTTKGYNKLVRSLIQQLRKAGSFSAGTIRQFLLDEGAESTRWPTDAEFRTAWVGRPVYGRLTRGRVRVVLETLELALHTGKSEKVTIESKLTIEHVMPQEWTKHWLLATGVPADEAKLRRDHLLHTFGNLTLVTGKLNPSMSNGAWAAKKTALSEHGALALNRKLCVLEAWDEAAIERRTDELFDLAKAIWPRPAVARPQ